MRSGLIMTIAVALAAMAHAQPVPPPPPLPAQPYTPGAAVPPPPTPDTVVDPELEPQVTIIRKETETLEEVRVAGELRYVRVTPRIGRPYYLVPRAGRLQRFDTLDTGLSVPMWQLFSW
ncbi:MAG: DUF2782 domain-containing protein [Burkholderiales bacterium]